MMLSSWEANSRVKSEGLLLCSQLHPTGPILNEKNPARILTPDLLKIHLSIILYALNLPTELFPSDFPTKILYAFISPMLATCSAHLTFLK
jgi:hypothetical protein